MGNVSSFKATDDLDINRQDFIMDCIIGKGGFSRVWRVEHRRTKQMFAMKEMRKFKVICKNSIPSVLNELKLLAKLKHPFLVNIHYAFQDPEKLYLVLDLMTGGDLRYHLGIHRTFSESTTKFFVACLVTALEYLHANKVIHRDVKPENLVLDHRGYLRLTDFGIARSLKTDNSSDTSGTPGYVAPEVLSKTGHGPAVDWYALGVIAFECMQGFRPYRGRNRMEIIEQMLVRQVNLRRSDLPKGWSIESADFINKLIHRKPQNRLGTNGVHEIKSHAWLIDFPWTKLLEKRFKSPFKPENADNFNMQSSSDWADFKDYSYDINKCSIQSLFSGYFFNVNVKLNANSIGSLGSNRRGLGRLQ